MQQFLEFLDKVTYSAVSITYDATSPKRITFELVADAFFPEQTCFIERHVAAYGKNYMQVFNRLETNEMFAILNKDSVISMAKDHVKQLMIKNWLLVNNKKEWRRTALYKRCGGHISGNLTGKMFELYYDGAKYGVDLGYQTPDTKVTNLHKLLADKFELLLEK